jgi:hypothetical protein
MTASGGRRSATLTLSGGQLRLAIITAGWAALLLGAHASAADVTSRILEGEVYYRVALPPCEVPSAVMRIARAAQIPTGIERLPEDCPAAWRPAASVPEHGKVNLTGKRVGEALNELVAADPRYAWIESDGVIVMRPVAAWTNGRHFLHRTIRSFTVVEQHAGVALQLWRQAVWEDTTPPGAFGPLRSEEANRPITVTIARESSAISALEQIARAHGRLLWEVNYSQPFAECRFATVVFRTTEDPRGLEWNTGLYVGMERRLGATIDACRSDR